MTGSERTALSDSMALIIENLRQLHDSQDKTRQDMNGWATRFEQQRKEDMQQRKEDMERIDKRIDEIHARVDPVVDFYNGAKGMPRYVGRVRSWLAAAGGVSMISYVIAQVTGWFR